MTGTLLNAGAVIAATCIGLIFKKGVPERITEAVIRVMGMCIFMVGLTGALQSMAVVQDGGLSFNGTLIMIFSLAFGCILGELLKIADKFDNFGIWVESKLKIDGFARGFITASMLFCVGAMTILGSIEEGLTGNFDILKIKTMLDFVMGIMLTASMGVGVGFSAVVIILYQGALTLCASFVAPFMTDVMIDQVSMVGYVIIMIMGLNNVFGEKIKTANLLPALFIPVIYNVFTMFI